MHPRTNLCMIFHFKSLLWKSSVNYIGLGNFHFGREAPLTHSPNSNHSNNNHFLIKIHKLIYLILSSFRYFHYFRMNHSLRISLVVIQFCLINFEWFSQIDNAFLKTSIYVLLALRQRYITLKFNNVKLICRVKYFARSEVMTGHKSLRLS